MQIGRKHKCWHECEVIFNDTGSAARGGASSGRVSAAARGNGEDAAELLCLEAGQAHLAKVPASPVTVQQLMFVTSRVPLPPTLDPPPLLTRSACRRNQNWRRKKHKSAVVSASLLWRQTVGTSLRCSWMAENSRLKSRASILKRSRRCFEQLAEATAALKCRRRRQEVEEAAASS